MYERVKTVFYCSHCKKHGLSRHAMEKHERHCTLNPERVCRWYLLEYESTRTIASGATTHRMRRALPRWLRLRRPLKQEDVDALREHCMGCPACMLATVRLAQLEWRDWDSNFRWSYEDEVKRYREDERDHWQAEEYRGIETSFL